MGNVTVVVATYGDSYWKSMARSHAIPSVGEDVECHHVHLADGTLHEARNAALELIDSEYVIHLDADDQLAPGYVDEMLRAARSFEGELFAPMVRYVRAGRGGRPAYFPNVAGHRHDCEANCLSAGNWLVVGTMAPTALVREVGGWRDFAWSEDWDLWLRCWRAGARIVRVPEATYTAWARPDSRNRGPDRAFKQAAHEAIHRANFPECYEEEVQGGV